VQVSGFYGFDNRYICDASKANPGFLAGVITLDPDDRHSPLLLAEHVREFGVRGMRSVPAREGRLDHPGVRALWTAAADNGVVVNLLTGAEHADEADRLLADYPSLPVVLDHSLDLEAGPGVDDTLAALARLSARKNLSTKLSFIGNGPAGCSDGYPCRSFHSTVLRVVELFGAERCAWGAHFPLERYSPRLTYGEHLRIYREELPLGEAQRRAVLGETARRLWFPDLEADEDGRAL
jgi:predicted TIM-barrel fold metal-dependent hydrolase